MENKINMMLDAMKDLKERDSDNIRKTLRNNGLSTQTREDLNWELYGLQKEIKILEEVKAEYKIICGVNKEIYTYESFKLINETDKNKSTDIMVDYEVSVEDLAKEIKKAISNAYRDMVNAWYDEFICKDNKCAYTSKVLQLQLLGIKCYHENGERRNTLEILEEIKDVWVSLTDNQKESIANVLLS